MTETYWTETDGKLVVTSLMNYVGSKIVQERSISKTYVKYSCPRPDCSKYIVQFPEKSGLDNPYLHLITCCAKKKSAVEQEKVMKDLFTKARNESMLKGGSIKKCFNTPSIFQHDDFVFAYLKLTLINRNLPLSFTESSEFRHLSKFKECVSARQIISAVLKLVESERHEFCLR